MMKLEGIMTALVTPLKQDGTVDEGALKALIEYQIAHKVNSLLLLGGMILVVLGIMGEYVGRIYMCANAAPQYVEREVIRHEEDDA